jgi:hypothetical protein
MMLKPPMGFACLLGRTAISRFAMAMDILTTLFVCVSTAS